jgi:hypothetical protein
LLFLYLEWVLEVLIPFVRTGTVVFLMHSLHLIMGREND